MDAAQQFQPCGFNSLASAMERAPSQASVCGGCPLRPPGGTVLTREQLDVAIGHALAAQRVDRLEEAVASIRAVFERKHPPDAEAELDEIHGILLELERA